MNIEIRRAQIQDIDWLIGQLGKFSQFFGSRIPLMGDEEYSRRFISNLIENHFFLVAEDQVAGRLGFISGFVTGHTYNPQIRTLAETFWWVDEEFRGSPAGKMLFDAFVEWGKANVDWILFTLERNSPVPDAFLHKHGFISQERNFLMEVS